MITFRAQSVFITGFVLRSKHGRTLDAYVYVCLLSDSDAVESIMIHAHVTFFRVTATITDLFNKACSCVGVEGAFTTLEQCACAATD